MEGKVTHIMKQPVNIENPDILKRYLQHITDKLNSNYFFTYPVVNGWGGTVPLQVAQEVGSTINSMLEAAVRVDALSGTVKNYVTGGLQTQVLQNLEDLATVTQQFGTFYDDATAAAWYGLTVKTGELISGFTVGGVDTDTTTPGTAGSFFAISADKFTVGRALEDIDDPTELAYAQAHGLPYGTMYDADLGQVVPAFLIEWNGTGYDIMFNGKVSFTNLSGNLTPAQQQYIDTANLINSNGWTDDTIADEAKMLAQSAQTLADDADAKADSSLAQISDLVSDNLLSPLEKFIIIADYAVIVSEQDGIDTQATNYGITVEKTAYDNAITALTTYLWTLTTPVAWDVTTGNTELPTSGPFLHDGGVVFRTKFQDVYTTRQALLNKIAATAKSLIDGISTGSGNSIFYEASTNPPTTDKANDLWFQTDQNYKMMIWSGTAWVDATRDAAAAINSNTTTINGSKITTGTITALQIAAETITAAKIAAGTITADLIAAGTITAAKVNTSSLQSALVTAAYINALNIVAGSVAAENITGTTISGKTISGGTITGTTINASTINIRNLNTINDAGYSVMPVFASNFGYNRNSSSPYTITWTSDIYTYNSTNASKAKTVGTTGTNISIALNGSGGFESPLAGWSVIFRYSSSATPVVRIKTGTTTQSSKTSGWTLDTAYNLSGIGFMYMQSGSYYYLLIRSNNTDLNIASTSSSANLIIECEPGNSSHSFVIMSLTALVSNL